MAKVKTGVVISTNMDKSVVVRVDRMVAHPLYGKRYRVSKKIMAHDQDNQYKIGDVVTIQETKPISKRKSWVVATKVGEEELTPTQELGK